MCKFSLLLRARWGGWVGCVGPAGKLKSNQQQPTYSPWYTVTSMLRIRSRTVLPNALPKHGKTLKIHIDNIYEIIFLVRNILYDDVLKRRGLRKSEILEPLRVYKWRFMVRQQQQQQQQQQQATCTSRFHNEQVQVSLKGWTIRCTCQK